MNKKIYIGNLNYQLETPDLQQAFAQYGEITDSVVIKDKDSGCSRGFGFVTFTTLDAAKSALEMNGAELGGRKIRVKLAEAKTRAPMY